MVSEPNFLPGGTHPNQQYMGLGRPDRPNHQMFLVSSKVPMVLPGDDQTWKTLEQKPGRPVEPGADLGAASGGHNEMPWRN